jgi:hypothetical protein
VIVVFALIVTPTLWAAPAHVIRFSAIGAHVAGCDSLAWGDVLTFYNSTAGTVTVRILGISNGPPSNLSPDHIDLPPGSVISANALLGSSWFPIGNPQATSALWIMHLEVPEGVVIESRDEMFDMYICNAEPGFLGSLGKVSLPVFRDAVPANQPQVHLGTDLGVKDARINVGIYNQSQSVANAHIEVRRSCDNSVVDRRDVQVPPDTLIQAGALRKGPDTCLANPTTQGWLRYTVVTVDQPSMTFATVISGQLNLTPGLAPEVGLGAPANARF